MILGDRCRLVAIVGMGGVGKTNLSIKLGKGGIGKTDLSIKLAKNVQSGFDYLIWRSLRDRPPIAEILSEIVRFLSNQTEIDFPEAIAKQITILIKYLKDRRCLLILDNAESVLTPSGHYQQGCEGYGQMFEMIGEIEHQSCLLITSREKFSNLERLRGEYSPVRCLELSGLSDVEGRNLFKPTESFLGQRFNGDN